MEKYNIAFYGDLGVSDEIRLGIPSRFLEVNGHTIEHGHYIQWEETDPDSFDIIYLSRPYLDAVDIVKEIVKSNAKLVIDMDDDFFSIPEEHPAYTGLGAGNKEYHQLLLEMIAQADAIVTASTMLHNKYKELNSSALHVHIPNGFDDQNELWGRKIIRDHKLNLGWCGTITHRKDVHLMLKPLLKVLRANEDVRIVIGGDYDIYRLFKNIPEKQKQFIPMVPYSIYPYMLAHMDVLLVPLVDNEFNSYKSDIKLVEAGAMEIPWCASPLPQYVDWGEVGGYLIEDEEWSKAFESIIHHDKQYSVRFPENKSEERLSCNMYDTHWKPFLQELMK